MINKRVILTLILSWRCLFADIFFVLADLNTKKIIEQDIYRLLKWNTLYNKKIQSSNSIFWLNYSLLFEKSFRSVLYYRMKGSKILCLLNECFLGRYKTIEIFAEKEIGKGLVVFHNHSVIFVKSAGENFRVAPGVVIGKNNSHFPTIGNNVYIAANATVIGDISIGDNVIIGAGCVVTRSIPSNGVYVGNPAKFIKALDKNSNLWQEIT